MKTSPFATLLLAAALAACGGQQNDGAVEAAVSEAAAVETASDSAVEMPAEPVAVGELPPVCRQAVAENEKYIATLSGEEKAEEQKHLDEWLAQLKLAEPAEQEESCKTALEAEKD